MAGSGEKVVVIGSGIGGAGCAALLQKKGFDVTLLEKNDFPGGKAASFEKDGFIYDVGVHAVGNGEKGPLGEINKIVGGNLRWLPITGGNRIAIGEREAHFPLDFASEEAIQGILDGLGVKPENRDDCYNCFKELATMKPASEMEILDVTPLKDYVDRFTDDPYFHYMINAVCGMLLVLTYYQASAGEFIYCFSKMASNSSLSYPEGGMISVPLSYIEALENLGGKVEFGRKAEKILVENGRVVGVEAGERIPADVVVSNAGLQPTVRMVEGYIGEDYRNWAMSLRSSYGAVSVKYALYEEVVESPLTLWIPDPADPQMLERYVGVFYPVPSIVDPGLVPEGCQLVLAGALVSPHPKHEQANNEIISKIEATMSMLHPGIDDFLVWKLRTGVSYIARISGHDLGEVIGLAQDFKQIGRNRPNPRMPIRGLYLVGADAGGRGIGTEMAGESALKVSEMIASDVLGSEDNDEL